MAGIYSIGAYYYSWYDLFGSPIIFAKACAMASVVWTMFVTFFISFDTMTFIRSKCKKWWVGWLDHYLMIHKFSGYMVAIYGTIHSIIHLTFTFRIMSNADVEDVHDWIGEDLDGEITYPKLLFTTLEGITGLILMISIIAIAITSLRWVRIRWFQIFGYTHMLFTPIFLTTLAIHGLGFWLTVILPIASVLVFPPTVMIFIQIGLRLFTSWIYKFEIIDISVSGKCNYIMIYFSKPKNFKLLHGQYVYLNIPEVHALQWHPFTVASSPTSPYLILMIKRAGDWTDKLIKVLYKWKWNMMKMSELNFTTYEQYDVFNILHDLHQEIQLKDVVTRNTLFYPKVRIGRACSTPNETFIERKDVILIGAGSGISPYLPLLEEVMRFDKGKSNALNYDTARLIFVAREGEQISWVSNYLFHIISINCVLPVLEFYIFITLNKEIKTLASFLFWRAFLLIQSQK